MCNFIVYLPVKIGINTHLGWCFFPEADYIFTLKWVNHLHVYMLPLSIFYHTDSLCSIICLLFMEASYRLPHHISWFQTTRGSPGCGSTDLRGRAVQLMGALPGRRETTTRKVCSGGEALCTSRRMLIFVIFFLKCNEVHNSNRRNIQKTNDMWWQKWHNTVKIYSRVTNLFLHF
jgi:hypothetical protein